LKLILSSGFLAAALLLSACGSNAKLLAERSGVEATHLQEICRRGGLATDETKRADDLLAKSKAQFKDGDEEAALGQSDLAETLYRLALARKELAETQAQVESLRTALAKDQDQLQTYQEILEEMKMRRKP
jgi:polyhydroxyalkanoate synthesis regulator phasin